MSSSRRNKATIFGVFVLFSTLIFPGGLLVEVVNSDGNKILPICQENLSEVPKNMFHLPASFEHFGGPWHSRPHSRLYSSSTVDTNFKRFFEQRIQGLNDVTIGKLLHYLRSKNCLPFVWGGAVRDAILGHFPNDIDLAVTCSPGRVKLACVEKFGSEACRRPHHGSAKLIIGRLGFHKGTGVTEPVDIAHWNNSFEVTGARMTYTVDTLAYYPAASSILQHFNAESGELSPPSADKGVIIDLNGQALRDVCSRQILIPTNAQFWNEWAEDEAPFKLLRFWTLRAKGFRCDRHTHDFIVKKTRATLTRKAYRHFYCNKIIDGRFVESESESQSVFDDDRNLNLSTDMGICVNPNNESGQNARATAFRLMLAADLGSEFWRRANLGPMDGGFGGDF